MNGVLSYDTQGRLSDVEVNDKSTYFLYLCEHLIAEYDDTLAMQKRYIHGQGVVETKTGDAKLSPGQQKLRMLLIKVKMLFPEERMQRKQV
ncbi:hypothetical protein [Opacimonas viscosa]|uniref:Uncharacterized protein n=1 Tax=Opacimonas viscosa TaxID=2961944 RepID=A0AA41X589_9ALTE|nr:hypothetical protein [Opacimonas viscosa]MCP3429741.1 hypothetical protein [Opacimonas viscosa]